MYTTNHFVNSVTTNSPMISLYFDCFHCLVHVNARWVYETFLYKVLHMAQAKWAFFENLCLYTPPPPHVGMWNFALTFTSARIILGKGCHNCDQEEGLILYPLCWKFLSGILASVGLFNVPQKFHLSLFKKKKKKKKKKTHPSST